MPRSASRPPPRAWHPGFTYITVLIAIAIVGLLAGAAVQAGAVLQRRAAEEALLETGASFRAALASYAKATPAGLSSAPATLQDLLRDPRLPGLLRHLRAIPHDPLTGRPEWGIVLSPQGQGITGVYSLSPARPIKVGHFGAEWPDFADRTSYADWVFALPPMAPPTAALPRPIPSPTRPP